MPCSRRGRLLRNGTKYPIRGHECLTLTYMTTGATPPPGGSQHTAKVAIAAALITATATIVGAVITARAGALPAGILPTTTAISTTTATTTVTVTSTVSVTANGPTTGVTPGPVIYLDDVDAVEGSLDKASVTWKAATFSRSLTNPLSGCSARGPIDWIIPVGVHQFDTEIGVATDAAEPNSKVTFSIYLDGQPAGSTTLGVGLHKPLDIDLKEASRLRLESIIDKSRRNNCNTEATAVWGDPHFS